MISFTNSFPCALLSNFLDPWLSQIGGHQAEVPAGRRSIHAMGSCYHQCTGKLRERHTPGGTVSITAKFAQISRDKHSLSRLRRACTQWKTLLDLIDQREMPLKCAFSYCGLVITERSPLSLTSAGAQSDRLRSQGLNNADVYTPNQARLNNVQNMRYLFVVIL